MVDALECNGQLLVHLYDGLDPQESRWRPAPSKWSLLEILAHLCDEERDDFRSRIRLTLENPGHPWPPIDPEGWARDRRYNEYDLRTTVDDFRRERQESLRWLRSLRETAWDQVHEHPQIGPMRAGDLLAAWSAHDLLHLQQIARTRLSFLTEQSRPFHIRYASP
jgi:hypothetical protein